MLSSNEPRVYGSSPSADIVVAGEGVAERHCQIVFDVDGYWLEDLLSTSGTYVNGEPITSRMLREGDTVHLGAAAFVFGNGTLQRQVKADVEQPLRMPEAPSLSRFSPQIPDDLPPIRTPGQSGRVRRAGALPKPARVLLTSLGVVIAGIVVLAVWNSNDPDQKSPAVEGAESAALKPLEAISVDRCGTELTESASQVSNALAIAERAFRIVEAKNRQAPPSVPSLAILTSPNTPATWEADLKPHLRNANGFWACEVPPTEPVVVRILHPDDNDWLFDQLWEMYEGEGHTREEVRNRVDEPWEGLGQKYSLILRPPRGMTKIRDLGATIAHEWIHHVQAVLEGYWSADLPCWWYEGHANYLGTAVEAVGVTHTENVDRFQRAREIMVRGWSSSEAANRSTTDWYDWLKSQEPGRVASESCWEDIDIYGAGALASEYLIGQYGLDAVIRVHSEFKYSVDWETRVSTVYGKSPDALNREIAEYLRSFASIFP